ncbi:hypothetical protein PBI_FLOOF_75 [Microbacterium phage Floof]|uniref:Uncharacterized protein n=1 Tax=Microbacterium phage Floof TaxID=2201433 RepID=A0A2Z4Q4R6_9CAUD|nr:hypothetical protein PBI_FLOOF_75 [Microbacterium phage Floof]
MPTQGDLRKVFTRCIVVYMNTAAATASSASTFRVAHAGFGLGLLGTATPNANEFGEMLVTWDNGASGFYTDAEVLHEGNIDPDAAGAAHWLAKLAA